MWNGYWLHENPYGSHGWRSYGSEKDNASVYEKDRKNKKEVSDMLRNEAKSFLQNRYPGKAQQEFLLSNGTQKLYWNTWGRQLDWTVSLNDSNILIGYEVAKAYFETWMIHVWIREGNRFNGWWTFSTFKDRREKAFEKFNELLQNEMDAKRVQKITVDEVDSILEKKKYK